jgi:F-type H+-transporting ATPase subunit epsilon
MAQLQCILVTPDRTVLDQQAEFVAMPLFDGEIGIAPDHTPMIGRLGCGEMRIDGPEGLDRYYVEGGFVEVLGNVVTVLTPRAIAASEIDCEVAREQLETALSRPAHTPESMTIRDRVISQTRAQLRVSRHGE